MAATIREYGRTIEEFDMDNPKCTRPDCDRGGRLRRGYCEYHYRKWLKLGKPDSSEWTRWMVNGTSATFEDRLLSRYVIDPVSGCWDWTGTFTWGGYGQIGREKTNVTAHRAMWEYHRGAIPEGLVLDHLCRNRGCVNPDHLEIVTYSENNFRRFRNGEREVPTP